MKQCPQCFNSEIGEKDNYCKICGMNLKGEAAAETTAQKNANKDRKYKKVTMSLSVPTRLVAFASNEEECKSLIEKEDWLLMFSPELGKQLGFTAQIWIVYKEYSPSPLGYTGGLSESQPKVK